MSLPKIRWGWVIIAVLSAEAILMLGHFLYIAAYSHWINPGREADFYQAHATNSGPYFVILTGIPVLLLICRWMLRRIEEPQAVPQIAAVLSLMLGLDLALYLLVAIAIPPIAAVAWASKWLGGFLALRFTPSAAKAS